MIEAVPQNTESTAQDCLAGGGQMGALMRSFDWASTALGPVASWPQSLRTSVSICLNSRFALLLWWGDDLTMLYNDAYATILGQKHPGALGRPGREVWPEIWDIVGTMLAGVRETGQATWSDDLLLLLERHGYAEECYFTFSYSPIRDESGGIGGIFTPVAETTEKVVGERRLRTLRDLAARSAEVRAVDEACRVAAETLAANPHDIPFALLYLRDEAGPQARLASTAGIEAGLPASPAQVGLAPRESAPSVWPLMSVFQTGAEAVVTDPSASFGPLPGGVWDQAPGQALVLPVTLPGNARPAAALVAAVSPRKALDAAYRSFFGLVAGQVAAMLAEALAYEEERRRAEALAEIDRAKTAFFSNVSHEFRTPLTLILGPVEDALGRERRALEGADLAAVHRNALRLLRLVNTLLDFSRIEAGRVQATYRPTDLAAFTADLASVFRSAVERAGVRLTVECPPLPEPVFVDREMWEKIVLNLLSNALKFTRRGEIAVCLRRAGDAVALTVRDTGTGIPAGEQSRLFERFHRITGAEGRTHEGSGIGLALVQELARLHGGSVRVESAVGAGSTFTVSVPLGAAHLPADQVAGLPATPPEARSAAQFLGETSQWLAEPARVTAPGAQASRRGRVVLADDNADMREYVARVLGGEYEVEAVADGMDALRAVRERPPDVVLSDIMMPRLDGLGLLAALRADPTSRDVPVVFLSARAGEEARVAGLEAGADDYLIKPFSARELRARIGTHVALARARGEARAALGAAYEHERTIAATFQRALLEVPPEDAFPGLRVYTGYEAALDDADVGGDFLDAFRLAGGRVALVVGDVSGKGLAAAAHTAEVKYALRAFLREDARPAAALARLNAVLCEAQILDPEHHDGFICLALAVVAPASGDVEFAAAGAERPLLVRASGGTEEMAPHGPPLGVTAEAEYKAAAGRLEPGDLLVMVTDGITEARRGRDFFGPEGLLQVVVSGGTAGPLPLLTRSILGTAKAFGGGTLRDDACLLLARREAPPA